MDAQKQKRDPKILPRMEGVALEMAQSMALAALGEIDTKSSITQKILIAALAHDQPMEWGGGIAHAALAKRGRAGLLTLMAESEQLDCKAHENRHQVDYISHAVSSIKDPALLPDLYAIGMNPKYFFRLRGDAVMSIGTMAIKNSEAEQIIIDIAKNKDTDIRGMAIRQLGRIGSPNALQVLKELLNDKKLDDKTKESVMIALLNCDTDNMLNGYVQRILSREVPDEKKVFMCQIIHGMDDAKLKRHVDNLKYLLNTTGADGTPLNNARLIIWCKLYYITKNVCDVEIEYESQKELKNQVQISSVVSNIYSKFFSNIRTPSYNLTSDEKRIANMPNNKQYEAITSDVILHIKQWKISK
ncbi:MAG: HEAT repeat domain-containing protein [Lentisphaeria bacterium]